MNYKQIYLCILLLGLLMMLLILLPQYQQWRHLLLEQDALQQKVVVASAALALAKPTLPSVDSLQQILKLATENKLIIENLIKDINDNYRLKLRGEYLSQINFIMNLAIIYPVTISNINIYKIAHLLMLDMSFNLVAASMPQPSQSLQITSPDWFCDLAQNIDLANVPAEELNVRGFIEHNGKHITLVQLPNNKIILM